MTTPRPDRQAAAPRHGEPGSERLGRRTRQGRAACWSDAWHDLRRSPIFSARRAADRCSWSSWRRSPGCSPPSTRRRRDLPTAQARQRPSAGALVRLRHPGLRRLRPHHLRRPRLDPGRRAAPRSSPRSSARPLGRRSPATTAAGSTAALPDHRHLLRDPARCSARLLILRGLRRTRQRRRGRSSLVLAVLGWPRSPGSCAPR